MMNHQANERQALDKLHSINQSHLFAYWHELNDIQRSHLLAQVEALDVHVLREQQQLLKRSPSQAPLDQQPIEPPPSSGNHADFMEGQEQIANGLVGCVIVAGGQGTRLGISGPKGTFPITPLHNKSLFQLFCEKVAAASRLAKRPLPLAIMTSPSNHAQTLAFFKEHDFFGLEASEVSFFSQGNLPLLDQQGNLFLESKDTIATGPDGNGLALHHFFHQKIWSHWHAKGITSINFIVIDNPLADPYDAELVGYHQRCHNDITIKCVLRKHPKENVGVLAKVGGKMVVVEYSELSETMREATSKEGNALFPYANISLFCFNMDFIKRIGGTPSTLPLHKAFKAASSIDKNGQTQQAKFPNAWKFETFIFDLLPLAKNVSALLYPREHCFSPLKNYEGEDSITTVRKALQESDKRTYLALTGTPYPGDICEISQDFYYPTVELLKKYTEGTVKKLP